MKLLKLALRSILNFRTYSSINLLGLALSLACVITIFRYVYGEMTVDHFNKKIDRIYLTTLERESNAEEVVFSSIYNMDNDETFMDITKHPGVEKYSHFNRFKDDEISVDDRKYYATVIMTDSNFLKITDFPVISGIDKLSEPNNALITKSYAQKLFGNENPVGKTLRTSSGEIVTISGIIGATSTKATLSFDMVVSLSNQMMYGYKNTLVLLYPRVDYQAINKQHEEFHYMGAIAGLERHQLFPLSKVYFNKSVKNFVFRQGNYNYVTVLMAVGVLILLTGIINYINIYTVVVLRRGRELGIKKVFGAGSSNIFKQLLTENLLMTLLALLFALYIAHLAYPFITNVLHIDQLRSIRFDVFLTFCFLLVLPVLTTLYPFVRHHYAVPVNSIRDFDKKQGGSLRRIFLSLQYMTTIFMIILSLFFVKQLHFMMNTDPGYHTKNIIKVQFLKRTANSIGSNREAYFKKQADDALIADEITRKMDACPLFTYWSLGQSPNEFSPNSLSFKSSGGEFKALNLQRVDENWFRLFNIQMKEGHFWGNQPDEDFRYALIVTESVLKLFGITDFNNILLQPERRLSFRSQEDLKTNPPYRIAGVVKDFNYLHLSQKGDPTAFLFSTEDKKIAAIYSLFTFIAIFVSALGLLSMSLFDIQQRRKEIAIRKINGATFQDIIRLLLKRYFRTLGLSFAIAAPIALFAIQRYLEDFAHKAPISWWLFAIALTLTVGISLLTLLYQTRKAATQNPAEIVNSE